MPLIISEPSLKRHREEAANSYFPYAPKPLAPPVPLSLQPDAKRTGIADTKPARQSRLQVIVEPYHFAELGEVEQRTKAPLSIRANAEKQKSLLSQPEVDRMPSTTENTHDPTHTEIWTFEKRNAALDEDEARLLGSFK